MGVGVSVMDLFFFTLLAAASQVWLGLCCFLYVCILDHIWWIVAKPPRLHKGARTQVDRCVELPHQHSIRSIALFEYLFYFSLSQRNLWFALHQHSCYNSVALHSEGGIRIIGKCKSNDFLSWIFFPPCLSGVLDQKEFPYMMHRF